MNLKDLTPAQRQLLATDFGELDKIAAEQVKFAGDLYAAGQTLAEQAADAMEKAAAEAAEKEKEDEEEKDEEKTAAARDNGNIVAEGFIDKLASLGQERYGDPMAYFIPLMEEKVAAAGARAALAKFAASKASFIQKMTDAAKSATGKTKKYLSGAKKDLTEAVTGKTTATKSKKAKNLTGMDRVKRLKEPGKIVGGLGLGGLGAYGASKALGGNNQ